MQKNNLVCRNFSDITDDDLDGLVKDILELDKGLG